jgi:hypothetical protein
MERCVGTVQYGAVCWDHTVWSGVLGPYREGQVSSLDRVQKIVAKSAYNINESGWETLHSVD